MPDTDKKVAEALHHATVENARLRGEIEALKQSPSWRLTKPVRAIKHLLKRKADGAS